MNSPKETTAVEDYNLGIGASNSEKVHEAIRLYKSAIEKDPKLYQAHSNLGSAFLKSGELKLAEQSFGKALSINPKAPVTLLGAAKLHSQLGDLSRAVIFADRCLKSDPRSASCHMTKGHALDLHKKHARAIAQYKKAIEIDPSLSLAHRSRCAIAARMERADLLFECVQAWRNAIPNDPNRNEIEEILGGP
ncbi:MAG: tetratricopeptide repeat protein [Bdellovibrionales bacterium]|nr:tetratricopeptide repeat protein [Bdellovibrionales bacterium]